MERRLTPRGLDRKRQLMDFAARRFAERGFHPTSVTEIVDGMGVGKGVFYWYFGSKEELLVEILEEAQIDLRRAQQAVCGSEPDPLRRIEKGIRASMRWLDANRHLDTLIQFARSEETFAPAIRRGGTVAVADVVRHLQEARFGRGRVSGHDVLTPERIEVTRHGQVMAILGPPPTGDAVTRLREEGRLKPASIRGPLPAPVPTRPAGLRGACRTPGRRAFR